MFFIIRIATDLISIMQIRNNSDFTQLFKAYCIPAYASMTLEQLRCFPLLPRKEVCSSNDKLESS